VSCYRLNGRAFLVSCGDRDAGCGNYGYAVLDTPYKNIVWAWQIGKNHTLKRSNEVHYYSAISIEKVQKRPTGYYSQKFDGPAAI
jgi:hypothetical protein